jgi:hypothetical protein
MTLAYFRRCERLSVIFAFGLERNVLLTNILEPFQHPGTNTGISCSVSTQ